MAPISNNSVINQRMRFYQSFHVESFFFLFILFIFFSILTSKITIFNHLIVFCFFFQIDFSKFDFPREIWFVKATAEIVSKLFLLLPIFLCGLIGNLLLLNIIIRNRALHTSTNYILANMISADTLTVIFCPLVFICSDFFQNFILGPIGCKMDGFLQGF